MTAPASNPRRIDIYGKLAFASVVLAVFSVFTRFERINGEPWQVVLVFTCGAIYAALGVFGIVGLSTQQAQKFHAVALYYLVQCGLATAIVMVTPLKGFSAIVTMPIVSMAVLDLNWRWASLVVLGLFAACVAALWIPHGAHVAMQEIPSYGIAFIFVVVFSFVTRQALESRNRAEQLSAEVTTANEQLRLYASQAGDLATTRERNRLAREIHDGLGHYLTTINVQLEAARAIFETQPAQAAAALEKAARLTREALDDVRRSVGSLRADVARPPLPDALQTLAQNLGLAVTVQLRGEPRLLPPAVEHALYRSAQEALTNVQKHSGATHTDVTLDFLSPACVTLAVADNGRGLPAAPVATDGHGLRGVRERIELLGGKLTTTNRAEGGFVLRLEVPA